MVRKLILVGLILVPVAALAAKPDPSLRPDVPFQVQQANVRSDLSAGEVYSEIAAADRDKVLAALDRVSAVVGEGTVDALPPEHKESVLKDQEMVNAVLDKARSDSRLICTREKPMGSNMPVRQCLTAAQRERNRQNTLQWQTTGGGRSATLGN